MGQNLKALKENVNVDTNTLYYTLYVGVKKSVRHVANGMNGLRCNIHNCTFIFYFNNMKFKTMEGTLTFTIINSQMKLVDLRNQDQKSNDNNVG
jgi:hypothetical protein